MGERNLRIILCHLFHHFSPEPGRIQHIGFINTRHLSASLHCYVKGLNGDSSDLFFIIYECVHSLKHAVHFLRMAFPEVKSSRKLPHDDHVEAVTDNFFLQGAGVRKLFIEIGRTYIGKKSESLPDSQQPGLRPQIWRHVIPSGIADVAADSAQQHRIALPRSLKRLVGERYPVNVDGCASHKHFCIFKCMAVYLSDTVKPLACLSHDLRTDTISRNHCDFIIHFLILLLR